MKPIAGLFAAGAALRAQTTDRRGNAAIEFALTAIPLLLFLFGIIEFGRTMWLQNALDYSVVEAARCASINPTLCGTAEQIKSYASDQSGAGFDVAVFSVTSPSCGTQVSAIYPLTLTIPTMSVSMILSAQSCFPS
jgi:hypothetical protein